MHTPPLTYGPLNAIVGVLTLQANINNMQKALYFLGISAFLIGIGGHAHALTSCGPGDKFDVNTGKACEAPTSCAQGHLFDIFTGKSCSNPSATVKAEPKVKVIDTTDYYKKRAEIIDKLINPVLYDGEQKKSSGGLLGGSRATAIANMRKRKPFVDAQKILLRDLDALYPCGNGIIFNVKTGKACDGSTVYNLTEADKEARIQEIKLFLTSADLPINQRIFPNFSTEDERLFRNELKELEN